MVNEVMLYKKMSPETEQTLRNHFILQKEEIFCFLVSAVRSGLVANPSINFDG